MNAAHLLFFFFNAATTPHPPVAEPGFGGSVYRPARENWRKRRANALLLSLLK